MRKLASIQRITALEPIPGADNIELAHILGWKVITQKNIHKVNDLVVFFEVDSFIPVDPRYEFLRKSSFKSTTNLGDGFRLRTMKLRKQVSQGLILPLNEFHELEGLEISELLNVQLYEKPVPAQLAGRVRGNFPMFIRKSDQERAQNLLKELKAYLGTPHQFEVTMKLDGSSMTVYCVEDMRMYGAEGDEPQPRIGVCSRNWDLDETDENAFWRCARKTGILETIKAARDIHGYDLAFQGELMGPGVQNNRGNLLDLSYFIYNIWDIHAQRYLDPPERMDLLLRLTNAGYHYEHVPNITVLSLDSICKADTIIDDLLKYADRPCVLNPDVCCEGLVFKSWDSPFQFKIINNQYLLQEKD